MAHRRDQKTDKINLCAIELEVIRVEYIGAYPAIGVRILDKTLTKTQIETALYNLIEELFERIPINELLKFVQRRDKNWKNIWNKLLET